MKESLDRSELHKMQREQERERRRIRDRQRRQSMTFEQRERHLARRRSNYQLRRLRAENAKVDCQSQQISNEHEETAAGGNGGNDAQQVTQTEKLSAEIPHYSVCLEAAVCKSANFTKRLRLSHIRRLARSLNHLGGEDIGNHQIVAEVITRGDANITSCFRIGDFDSGRLPNGLRLNRVKRLARTLNIAAHETSVNCPKVDQNVSAEEVSVTGDDKPIFGQTIRVGGDVEGPNMDGNNQLQFPYCMKEES